MADTTPLVSVAYSIVDFMITFLSSVRARAGISLRGFGDIVHGIQSYPRGFAPRTPLHALSRAASSARSVRVAHFRLRYRYGETSPKRLRREGGRSSSFALFVR